MAVGELIGAKIDLNYKLTSREREREREKRDGRPTERGREKQFFFMPTGHRRPS